MATGSRSPRIAGDPRDRFDAIFPGTSQSRAVAGASAQSAAVGANVSVLRLFSTTDTWIQIGANPTALATGASMYLPAGTVEYVGCAGGDKVAALQVSGAGTLYITEGAS